MKLTRRSVFPVMAGGVALGLAPQSGFAQATYPDHEIKAICNFPAGTGADIFVRFYAERLSAELGKQVLVDNRGGALGNIGTEAAAKSKPDGYTILIAPGSSTMAAAKSVFKTLPFDPQKDFKPVTTLSRLGFVILVDAKSPIKTLADLTAELKKKDGKGQYGANSNTGIIMAELYKNVAGLKADKIQYKDNQTLLNDLYAGTLDFITNDAPWASEPVKSGKLRALAVSSGIRMQALPDVPTMEEAGIKGFGKVEPWWAVFVPAATPQPIVDRLETTFNKIAVSDEAKKFLGGLGSEPYPGNQKMLKDLLADEIGNWAKYTKLAGIEPQ